MEDNNADFAAWLFDLQTGRSTEAAPFFAEETDDAFSKFVEQNELKAAGARGRAADPGRLRSERRPAEPEGETSFGKRANTARIEKSQNGTVCEFDEAGNLTRCYVKGVSPEDFANLDACRCRE